MDNMTRRRRSIHMSRMRSAGTGPEKTLREMIRKIFDEPIRCNVRSIPGTPDIVIQRIKLAVFADGCFWHGCPDHGYLAKSRSAYWHSKIINTMIHDEEVTVALEETGWTVWRVWEHDLKKECVAKTAAKLRRRAKKFLALDAS